MFKNNNLIQPDKIINRDFKKLSIDDDKIVVLQIFSYLGQHEKNCTISTIAIAVVRLRGKS